MKELKKIICAFVLLAGILYFDNINASENSIIVAEEVLDSTNNIAYDGKGGTAKWDSEENTLTLENFNYVGSGKTVANDGYIDFDLNYFNVMLASFNTNDIKIVVKGENKFEFLLGESEEELALFGGVFQSDVVFEGDGSLNIVSFGSEKVAAFASFYIVGDCTIDGVSFNIDIPKKYKDGYIIGFMVVPEEDGKGFLTINNANFVINNNSKSTYDNTLYSHEKISLKNSYLEINYDEAVTTCEYVLYSDNLLLDNSIVKINTSKIEEIKVMHFENNISINNSKLTIDTKGTAFVTDELCVDNSVLNITSGSVTSTGKIIFDFSSYNKEGYDVKIDDVSCVDFPNNLNDKHKLVTIIPENEGEYKYDLNAGNMEVLTSNIANYVNLTDIEKEFIGFGNDMLFGLDINDNCKDTDLSLIKNNLDGYIFGKAFDITLYKKLGTDGNKSNISDLTNKIKLSYKLDDSLVSENRTYKVIRLHNGTVDALDATLDFTNKELVFETDKFSTYAVVYKDIIVLEPEEEEDLKKEEDNPKTGDNIKTNIILGSLSLIGLLGSGLYIIKRKRFN